MCTWSKRSTGWSLSLVSIPKSRSARFDPGRPQLLSGFVEPVEGVTVIRLAPRFLSLVQIPLHVLESSL